MSNVDALVSVVVVKITGEPLSSTQEARLSGIIVERAVSTCDRFELRFDIWADDSPIASIGDTVEVSVDHRGAHTTLLVAEVTSKSIEVRSGSRSLVLTGYDKRHRLTRTIGTRAFNDSTLATVVSKIAAEHGLALRDETGGKLGATTYPHVVQASSDFDLLQQIAHRIGAAWLVVDDRIVFQTGAKATNVATLSPEIDLLSFNVRFSPVESASEVTVYGWDAVQGRSIVGTARDPQPLHSFPVATDERKKLKAGRAISWSTTVISKVEADGVAESISRRLIDASVAGHGETTGTPSLVPGALCTVSDVGTDFGGTYFVTSVEHSFGRDGSYRTRFRIGALEPGSVVDLLGGQRLGTGHVFAGVTIGIVTNVEHPDGRSGVVKVKLPYLGEQIETDWARLISFGGGPKRGAVFIPEVDDEVLVAFEHGDVSRPYVLGTVTNASNDDEFDRKVDKGTVSERSIVSRLGTKVRFLDMERGDKQSGFAIEVDDAKTRLFFGYDKTELITDRRPLELKNGKASILLTDDKITITAMEVTIKADSGAVKISGKDVQVDAQMKVSMNGAQVEMKAKAQATLESSGITVIKGSIVKVN